MAFESTSCAKGGSDTTALQRSLIGNGIQLEATVKCLISERRRRNAYFPAYLFADPAWDLLLVLALAQARQHRITVTQLYERAGVPATTVLRWIGKLTDHGLCVRRTDKMDRRRQFIELSPEAQGLMAAYCSARGAAMPLAA